jgi:hypothetical protein
MKLGENIIVNLTAKSGRIRLRMPFGASYEMPALSAETFAAMQKFSFASGAASLQPADGGEVNPSLTFDQVNPQDADYIYPKFRALDAALVEDYWIDFSAPGVVEKSVPLMMGRTIYSNHIYWKIENWIGAVSQSIWDPTGDKANGKPGLNTVLKVDWKKAPMIARGLLMKPPAIDAVSATIDFVWDASHPDLLEQGIFWRNLGQNIDDQIVRIIVTEIRRFYELSLVYMGANEGSNGQLPDDPGEDDPTGMSAPQLSAKQPLQLVKSKETKKVKLTTDQKTKLGLTAHQGEEVDDAIVIAAAESFATRATAADGIVSAQRAEVLRLATIAEGTGEGDARKLDPTIATLIEKADASQLPGLTTMYQKKVDELLPLTCDQGHKLTSRRSSVEDAPIVKTDAAHVPTTNLL